jgi:hypothetical protein
MHESQERSFFFSAQFKIQETIFSLINSTDKKGFPWKNYDFFCHWTYVPFVWVFSSRYSASLRAQNRRPDSQRRGTDAIATVRSCFQDSGTKIDRSEGRNLLLRDTAQQWQCCGDTFSDNVIWCLSAICTPRHGKKNSDSVVGIHLVTMWSAVCTPRHM